MGHVGNIYYSTYNRRIIVTERPHYHTKVSNSKSVALLWSPEYLRQEYHIQNDSLFYQRIIMEAVHELGHAFGLNHCNNSVCVMDFSNSIKDTDINSFCDMCKKTNMTSYV